MEKHQIEAWRREGLNDAEIGRRLGVSAEQLREHLGEPPPAPEQDDNFVNRQPVR